MGWLVPRGGSAGRFGAVGWGVPGHGGGGQLQALKLWLREIVNALVHATTGKIAAVRLEQVGAFDAAGIRFAS